MPLPLRDLYLEALELFTAEALAAADWVGLRSACSEWSIGDVVRHAIAIQRGNVLGPLAGETPVGGGPLLADVPAMAAIGVWEHVATDAADAARGMDERALGSLYVPTMDLTMHAWDIRWGVVRVGLAAPLELPEPLLRFLEGFRERAEDEALRQEGIFADAVRTEAGASRTDAVMAWAGRRVLPGARASAAG